MKNFRYNESLTILEKEPSDYKKDGEHTESALIKKLIQAAEKTRKDSFNGPSKDSESD